MGAGSFVDDGALPGWLRGQNGGQPAPDAGYNAPGASSINGGTNAGYRQAGGAPNMLPHYGPSDPAEPAPAQFSASDLIDPRALPGWVQRSGDPQASFSSSAGWSVQQPTIRQPRADDADPAPRGATGRQLAFDERYDERDAGARRDDPAPRDRDRQTGAYPATGSQIPQQELPPWLQGAPNAGVGGIPARPSAYEDDQRLARGNARQAPQENGYEDEWDDPNYGESSYQEAYLGDPDPRQQGYAAPYDDRYDYDPRSGQRRPQGYADGYDDASAVGPAYRGERERGYGVDSEEAYDDPDYDSVGNAWQPRENDDQGGNGKRGGWRKLFGRR